MSLFSFKSISFKQKKPPVELLFSAVEHWFQTDQGQLLLAAELRQLESSLAECFGYHLVQLSVSRKQVLYESSRVQHNFSCYPLAGLANTTGAEVDVRSEFDQLPFATASVDAVILHHCHEFVENPQKVLREVERITVNGGHVIVLGFNPYSLMGIQGLITRYLPRSIWHNKSLSHHRMADWLSLLGFQLKQQQFGYHHLERRQRQSANGLVNKLYSLMRKLPLGSFYCMTAIKQEVALTPDSKHWLKSSPGFAALNPKANIRHGKVVPLKRR